MSHATSLASVSQQLAISTGVAVGALAVEAVLGFQHHPTLSAPDFPPAFVIVACIAAASALFFAWLPADAGKELTVRSADSPSEAGKPAGQRDA